MADLTTGTARISYEHLTKAYSQDVSQKPKYSCTVLLPKSDTKAVEAMQKAIEQAKKEGVEKKWDGKMPPKVAVCVHDGDKPKESTGEPFGPECKGMWVFTASAAEDRKPPIVDNHLMPITDSTEIYSGMWARVCVSFFPYAFSGKKGIGCSLKAVQKVKDDDPLGGGRVNINKCFSAFDVDPITGEPVESDSVPF